MVLFICPHERKITPEIVIRETWYVVTDDEFVEVARFARCVFCGKILAKKVVNGHLLEVLK